MSFLNNLDWRYATKKFDETKKISSENLTKILDSIRKTPTSYGIQPFQVVVVSSREIQEKLQFVSYHQPQIGSASEVLVFLANTDLAAVSNEFFDELSGGDAEKRAKLADYENIVRAGIEGKYAKNPLQYASEQAHIALWFALAAAAELHIDSCAIGGFEAEKVAEILHLSENLIPVVLLPIGYRDASENPRPKFRKSPEKIFSFVQ